MITLFYVLIGSVLVIYSMWIAFLMVMALDAARAAGTLTTLTCRLALPAYAVATALNALVNVTVLTVVFGELPREWLICQRLARHADGKGLQGRFARTIFRTLIHPFDPDLQIKRQAKKRPG